MPRVYPDLPFPRGDTLCGLNSIKTPTATTEPGIPGRVYEHKDTVHDTPKTVYLIAVRNETGGDITVARDFCQFATTELDNFREIGAFGTDCSAGVFSLGLDDAYTLADVIPEHDVFYCVLEGPVGVRAEASSVSLSAGDSVACDASGRVNGAVCAAGEASCGVLDADASTADAVIVIHALGLGAKQPA
jgi:hypothetical protein